MVVVVVVVVVCVCVCVCVCGDSGGSGGGGGGNQLLHETIFALSIKFRHVQQKMTPRLYIAHQVALFTHVYKKEQAVFSSFTFKSAESTVIKMEKHIIVSKQELCGRSQKSMRMLENVVKHNSLNKTGLINYNKDGVKDGVGKGV